MADHTQAQEIMVWWMEVDAPPPSAVATWRACLDTTEQARADRFHFDDDRATYIAAHWLLRHALTAFDGSDHLSAGATPDEKIGPAGPPGALAPEEWRFTAEKYGKPIVDPALGRSDLRFSLSHTKGLVACAIGLDAMIGIDVETLSRKRSALEIAERFFSPSEIELLGRTALHLKINTFFRLWTLKEAFIKATGEGLHRALGSFSFSLDPPSITFHSGDATRAEEWEFLEKQPTGNHLLALALWRPAGRSSRLSFRQVPRASSPHASAV